MKKNAKSFKKLKRIFLFAFLFLAVLLGLLYFLVIQNFKKSVQFIVRTETKDKYVFDAGSATISIFKKQIIFKNASLHGLDTANATMHYELEIPDLDFSFYSWRDLIFEKKIRVKNLTLIGPSLIIHDHNLPGSKKKEKFKPGDILRFLNHTLTFLNVKSLNLHQGSFVYSKISVPKPFVVRDINFSISDFSKVDNNDDHLFGSENITVNLGAQHWIMPDGQSELAFSKLNFFSKGQRFEVDSFAFKKYETVDEGEINFTVNKFFFNSKHLPAIYQKEKLLIDTIYFLNPHLSVVEDSEDKIKSGKDTTTKKTDDKFFKFVQINFISILDAELSINNKQSQKNTADKNNIFIYNLTVDNEKGGALSTDSITLNLNAMEFYNKDSLFKLRIEKFSLNNNAAIFAGVKYGASEKNKSPGGITFSSPSFLLNRIDIPELIKGHIKAYGAELYHPDILIVQKKQTLSLKQRKVKSRNSKVAFFKNLQSVNDLIDIEELRIYNGRGRYLSWDKKSLSIDVSGINAKIELGNLNAMEEFPDFQYAVANIGMKDIKITSRKFIAIIDGYALDGKKFQSKVAKLQFHLANGSQLKGENIVWKNLDWDQFQDNQKLKLDEVDVEKLEVNLLTSLKTEEKGNNKDFPIEVGLLKVNEVSFIQDGTQSRLAFQANNFIIKDFKKAGRDFVWQSAKFDAHHFTFQDIYTSASINGMHFNDGRLTFQGVSYENKNADKHIVFQLDSLQALASINTSGFTILPIDILSLVGGSFILNRFKKPETKTAAAFQLPFDIFVNELDASNLDFKLFREDTTSIMGYASLFGKEISIPQKNHTISADKIQLKLDKLNVSNPKVTLLDSQFHLLAQNIIWNQNTASISAGIDAHGSGIKGSFQSDSTTVTGEGIGFELNKPNFHFAFNADKKYNWWQDLGYLKLNGGELLFRNRTLSASAKKWSFTPSNKKFSVHQYSFTPNESKEESFSKAKWQNDYVTVNGDAIEFELGGHFSDSLIHLKALSLDAFNVDVSRDKRLPFEYGVEKLMPTQLIKRIPIPVSIEQINLNDGNINYHEFSLATNRWVLIPFSKMNGSISTITNQPQTFDSLVVNLQSNLLEGRIDRFRYAESYADSLSGFIAENHLSPSSLTSFTNISHPMAGAVITRGSVDTMAAYWQGNKYLAIGIMDFYYDGLKIKLMDKPDISKQSFGSSLKTFAVNLFLPNKRKKTSVIFFERDRERFIFNYWIKTHAAGLLSTVGLKKNRKQLKKFQNHPNQFTLPENVKAAF